MGNILYCTVQECHTFPCIHSSRPVGYCSRSYRDGGCCGMGFCFSHGCLCLRAVQVVCAYLFLQQAAAQRLG